MYFIRFEIFPTLGTKDGKIHVVLCSAELYCLILCAEYMYRTACTSESHRSTEILRFPRDVKTFLAAIPLSLNTDLLLL